MSQDTQAFTIEHFEHPPNNTRLFRILHRFPESETEQQELIDRLLLQGFGGLAVNAWGEGYLRVTENIRSLGAFLERARAAGLSLWLYDEWGYPSGTAGGMTLEGHPEWEVHGLCVRSVVANGEVRITPPPGEWVAAFAYPTNRPGPGAPQPSTLAIRLQNGCVEADLEKGEWKAVFVTKSRLLEGFIATIAHDFKTPRPYPDLMNPEPVDRFLKVTHGRYAEVLGDDLGKFFFATFTDEPSSMALSFRVQSLDGPPGEQLLPMPDYAVLPWSPVLSQLLKERYGTSLESLLPALTADPGPEGQRTRYRYFGGVAELMSESFFGRLQDQCHAYNTRSGGHPLIEETLLAHITLYGDLFRCLRRMDAPGIDVLSSIPENVPWHAARMVSSVASLNGATYTMSEPSAFRELRPGGTEPPLEVIRGALNRQLLGGITCFNVYYRFDGLTDAEIVALNAYVGRCVTMLTGGHRRSHVAVLYPIETLWTRWLPEPTAIGGAGGFDRVHPRARQVDQAFRSISELLYENRIEFDYIDSQALVDASVESGALVHGEQAWDVIVLPEVDTLPLAAWQRLAALRESGGKILALGARPLNSEVDFPSPEVRRIAGALLEPNASPGAGLCVESWDGPALVTVLRQWVGKGLQVTDDASPLRYTHRVRDGQGIVFVINDSDRSFQETLTLPLDGMVERWDPVTGRVEPCGSGQTVHCHFEPYQGVLFRTRKRGS